MLLKKHSVSCNVLNSVTTFNSALLSKLVFNNLTQFHFPSHCSITLLYITSLDSTTQVECTICKGNTTLSLVLPPFCPSYLNQPSGWFSLCLTAPTESHELPPDVDHCCFAFSSSFHFLFWFLCLLICSSAPLVSLLSALFLGSVSLFSVHFLDAFCFI